MNGISAGMKVKHKTGHKKGVVTAIEGDEAVVSYDVGQEARVALVALEPWDPDKEVRTAQAPYEF